MCEEVIWIPNSYGKLNEVATMYRGVVITIFSDEDNQWVYYFDTRDDELYGPLDSLEEAKSAAILEVDYAEEKE